MFAVKIFFFIAENLLTYSTRDTHLLKITAKISLIV